jgi:hypothetical protein
MTHSTIALACGWCSDDENAASIDKYEGNYQAVKPRLFTVLNKLIREDSGRTSRCEVSDHRQLQLF